jgi:hypothetical protein
MSERPKTIHVRHPDGTVREFVSDGSLHVKGEPVATERAAPTPGAPALVRGTRYFVPYDVKYDTLEEALAQACGDVECNLSHPIAIEQDGKLVMDCDEIYAESNRRYS